MTQHQPAPTPADTVRADADAAGHDALALAAELRERIARDRATAQALRDYLQARGTGR